MAFFRELYRNAEHKTSSSKRQHQYPRANTTKTRTHQWASQMHEPNKQKEPKNVQPKEKKRNCGGERERARQPNALLLCISDAFSDFIAFYYILSLEFSLHLLLCTIRSFDFVCLFLVCSGRCGFKHSFLCVCHTMQFGFKRTTKSAATDDQCIGFWTTEIVHWVSEDVRKTIKCFTISMNFETKCFAFFSSPLFVFFSGWSANATAIQRWESLLNSFASSRSACFVHNF